MEANDALGEFALNVVVEFIPLILGFILALVVYVAYVFDKQRKLVRFLGTNKEDKRVDVYLSRLLVPPGRAAGFDGVMRSYSGGAVPDYELTIASRLGGMLSTRGFEYFPPVLMKALQSRFAMFRPLEAYFIASPLDEKDINFTGQAIITVGSQGYNVVTNYCVDKGLVQLQIAKNGTAIQIVKGKNKEEIIERPSQGHDIAILERIVDRARNNTTIIVGAGLGVIGTTGAFQYLIDHWQELDKKYKNQEFALVLQFGPVDKVSIEEVLKGEVVRRLPD